MQITCPSCGATYRVRAESLGAGRQVRCARCRTEWRALATDAAPTGTAREEGASALPSPILGLDDAGELEAVERIEPERDAALRSGRGAPEGRAPRRLMFTRAAKTSPPSPVPEPAPARPSPRTAGARLRPAAAFVAAGIAVCGLLVGERTAMVRFAPSLASFYAAIGLPVNVRGLAIRDVRSIEEISDGSPLLLVTGEVENVSGAELDVPRLRLAVTASGDREIYSWTTIAARPRLGPGETAAFRARLASPPAEGQAIKVRFLAQRDLLASAVR